MTRLAFILAKKKILEIFFIILKYVNIQRHIISCKTASLNKSLTILNIYNIKITYYTHKNSYSTLT